VSFLRRMSTQRLIVLCAALLVVAGGGAAIAVAASSGGSVPERKPLANAVHDALASPDVQGVTARIEFTNHLVDGIDLRGSNPVLGGATGRLWATDDGRFRLELQSSGGDAQVVSDGKTWWAYDGSSHTVYRGTVPKHERAQRRTHKWQVPSVGRIQRVINRVMRHAAITGPTPTNVAGEPAYTVRMEPRRNGGLLGALEFAWDAQRGTPLRGAVYAKGDSDPVLELKATEIDFGSVNSSVFDVPAPTDGVKTETIKPHGHDGARGRNGHGKHVTGLRRVKSRAGFDVSAPATLAGRKRQEVALLGRGKSGRGVLVTYGRGLDGIAVIEKRVRAGEARKGPLAHAELPTVAIGAVSGQELETPLGTAIRFERAGISYTVVASAPKALVESAARGL
jgi:hypothetical protein